MCWLSGFHAFEKSQHCRGWKAATTYEPKGATHGQYLRQNFTRQFWLPYIAVLEILHTVYRHHFAIFWVKIEIGEGIERQCSIIAAADSRPCLRMR
jgi:hypothetical protein